MIVSGAFLAIDLAAEESLLLLILKKRAEYLKKNHLLKMFQFPFEVPDLKTDILFKEADADNPVKQWFKSVLVRLIG